MNTTTPYIKPPPPPSAVSRRSTTLGGRPPHPETSTVGGLLGADLPLIGIVPFGLPSVLFVAGWVLLALCLVGPFVLLLTIALAMVIVVAVTAGFLALPYLLVRGLHGYRVRER